MMFDCGFIAVTIFYQSQNSHNLLSKFVLSLSEKDFEGFNLLRHKGHEYVVNLISFACPIFCKVV